MGMKNSKKNSFEASYSASSCKGMLYAAVIVITAFTLWIAYSYYLNVLFENVRFFSHLADFERDMVYRTEMGFYFSFYKNLVFSDTFSEGVHKLLRDNETEFGHSINTLRRFNLYPELLISSAYRIFKQLTSYLNWNDQSCWYINRENDMPYVESCDGPGNYHCFYLYSVFSISGSVVVSLFLLGVILSDNFVGGILAVIAFLYNHGEATRVQWTPPLRESFAYPTLVAEILILTHLLKRPSTADAKWIGPLLILFTTLSCIFWQFSQFVIFVQLVSLTLCFSLEFISSMQMIYLLRAFSTSFVISTCFLFANPMFFNSLYATALVAILVLLVSRRLLCRITFRPLFVLAHLILFFSVSLGLNMAIRRVLTLAEDGHIGELLRSKFSDFATFHTRLYTCAAEFDFLSIDTVEKLTATWLIPTGILCLAIFLLNFVRTDLSGSRWLWRYAEISPFEKDSAEQVFNFALLICFSLMALLIMRLKLFLTPQLCVISSLFASRKFLATCDGRLLKIRWLLVTVLLAGMSYRGVENMREQWNLRGEYSNPAQERLFNWINSSTAPGSVFAGSMAVMANVKLSTGRPIVNHPHYESQIMRDRTLLVYSLYSRKPLDEVYGALRKMRVDHYIFQPDMCVESHPKSGCSYLAMWDLEDPVNAQQSSLCRRIWEAVQLRDNKLIHPFKISFTDDLYPSAYVVLSLA